MKQHFFLYDLTDRTPNFYYMTFPVTYNLTTAKRERVKCFQVMDVLYEVGIESVNSPNGNHICAYSRERTLCDILRPKSPVDMDATIKGFPVDEQTVKKMFDQLCQIDLNDDVRFTFRHMEEIREGDEYTGYRVALFTP